MDNKNAWANDVYLDAEWSPYNMAEHKARAETYIRGVKLRRLAQHCLRTEAVLRLLITAAGMFAAAAALVYAI